MKKLLCVTLAVATVALFSGGSLLGPVGEAQAIDSHYIDDSAITIDGVFSDWEGIDPVVTDSADVTGITYYHDGTSWSTTDPGNEFATTNQEQMLDLLNMSVLHSDESFFVNMHFVRNPFSVNLTSAGKQYLSTVYSGTPVSQIPTIIEFLPEMPAPADYDHSFVVSIDEDGNGSFDYYLTFVFHWDAGDNITPPFVQGPGGPDGIENDPMEVSGFLYQEDGNDGVFSGASNEKLVHSFDADTMEVGVDQTGQEAKVELKNSLARIFGSTNLNWNDAVKIRYEAHSEALDFSSTVDYAFDQGTVVTPSLITGAGPTGGSHVRSFTTSGVVEADPDKLMAYATDYRGGVRVATGDIDNDGVDEIITGTGENGGPHLRVFEKDGTQRGIDFFPFDNSFRGGMDVASGDFDGDGKDDIAVSQFSKGQAWVKVYRYNSNRDILFERNIFGDVESGATVAMGQLDSDSKMELVVGAGEGGDPYVKVFDYEPTSTYGILKPTDILASIGDSTDPTRTGIDVAVGNVDSDALDEIVVSNIRNNYPWVGVYDYHSNYNYNENPTRLKQFKAYGDYQIGTNVAMHDIDSDGKAEILTGAGPGGGPQIRAFESDGTVLSTLDKFFAYDEGFRGGVDVAVGDF